MKKYIKHTKKLFFRSLKKSAEPYIYLLPALFFLAGLMVYPIGIVLKYSVLDNVIVTQNPHFVGIENYKTILSDPLFIASIGRTLYFTIGSVAFHLILGLIFALLLNANSNPLIRSILRAFYILPWLFTATIVAIIWRLILNPMGVMNFFLEKIHIISAYIEWFSDVKTALPALTIVNIWAGYPFFMVSLLAGLQGVPTELYEAAIIDGSNAFEQFCFVTLPHLLPIIFSIGLLDFIWTMQVFPLIWMTTGGGPINTTEVMSTFTYKLTFNRFEFSLASASAMIMLLMSAALSAAYLRKQKLDL